MRNRGRSRWTAILRNGANGKLYGICGRSRRTTILRNKANVNPWRFADCRSIGKWVSPRRLRLAAHPPSCRRSGLFVPWCFPRDSGRESLLTRSQDGNDGQVFSPRGFGYESASLAFILSAPWALAQSTDKKLADYFGFSRSSSTSLRIGSATSAYKTWTATRSTTSSSPTMAGRGSTCC